ncbi:MAG TPA: hypothetical protein DDW23_05145, partial [Planctomycetes bacterium]|nr:hypothetical protein [Planctomycetota bacterium]
FRGLTDSGMEVIVAPRPGFSTASAHLGLRFGSVHTRFLDDSGEEVSVPDGSAHYLEHKLFEGKEEKVFDRFGRLGAQFNGGTGFHTTTYYFSTSRNFTESLDVLLDFVLNPLITEERVEKERGIIEQEVRMYEDDPGFRSHFLLHRALYSNLRLRVSPGGRVSDVKAITAADIQACYDAFYSPSSLCLVVSGDLNPDEIFEQAQLLTPAESGAMGQFLPVDEPEVVAEPWLEEEFPLARSRTLIGWRESVSPGTGELGLRRRLAAHFALDMLFGLSGRSHADLYDRGVVDDSFGHHYSDGPDHGYAAVVGSPENPESFVREIKNAATTFLARGVKGKNLERLKRAALGGLAGSLESPSALASALLGSRLRDEDPFAARSLISTVTCEEVDACARELLDPARSAVAVLRPSL